MKAQVFVIAVSGAFLCASLQAQTSGSVGAAKGIGTTLGSPAGSMTDGTTTGTTPGGSTTMGGTSGANVGTAPGAGGGNVGAATAGVGSAPTLGSSASIATSNYSGAVSSTQLQPQSPNANVQVPRNDAQGRPGAPGGVGAVSSTALTPPTATGQGSVSGGVGIGAGSSTGLGIGAGSSTGLGLGAGSSSGVPPGGSTQLPNGAWVPNSRLGRGTLGSGVLGGGTLPTVPTTSATAPVVPGTAATITTPAVGASDTNLGGVTTGGAASMPPDPRLLLTNRLGLTNGFGAWTNRMRALTNGAGAWTNAAGAWTNGMAATNGLGVQRQTGEVIAPRGPSPVWGAEPPAKQLNNQ